MNKKIKSLALPAASVILAGVFLMFGAGKFIDPFKWTEKFVAWGLPEWFVSVSGFLEIAGAVGLLIPVLRGLAGLGLALFMVGAVGTHIVHAEVGMIFVAGSILVASAVVGWKRLPETTAFFHQFAGRSRKASEAH